MIHIQDEVERIYREGPIYTVGEDKQVYIISKKYGLIVSCADTGKNQKLMFEICGRWNTFPAMYQMLRTIHAYGPIDEKGKCSVPLCWCCGATEGEEHASICVYTDIANFFKFHCRKHFVEE